MTNTTGEATEVQQEHRTERIAAAAGRAITMVVYVYVVIVEMILALGFFLLLLGANPTSSFVEWVYRSMDRAMKPFRGIFSPIEVGVAGNDVPSVLETSVLFAMIIYCIIAIAASSLLHWLATRIGHIDRGNEQRQLEQNHREADLAYRQALLQAQMAESPGPVLAPTAPPPASSLARPSEPHLLD